MFLLSSLLPISFGILAYIFNKKHKIFAIFSYIIEFYILIFSKFGTIIPGKWNPINGIELLYNYEIKVILLSIFLFSLINYIRIIKKYGSEFTFLWLILNGVINSFFMSRDFFNLYVHLELISMIVFLLIPLDRTEKRIWASLKYMIMSGVALNFYLIGVGIWYSVSGTLNIIEIQNYTMPIFAQTFIVTGLLIKTGSFFLGGWLPDAHAEAMKGISPILSGIVVELGYFILYYINGSFDNKIKRMLVYYAVIATIVSSIFTYFQNNFKRYLAYSTMTQMGYALLVICLKPELFPYFFIYHLFSKGFLFFIAEDLHMEKMNEKKIEVSLDTFILTALLLFNMSGIYPSTLYFIKKAIHSPIIFEINAFIFGLYFIKLLNGMKINFKIKPLKIYMFFSFFIFYFLSYNYYVFDLKKVLISYVMFIFAFVFHKILKKFNGEKFNIYKFEDTIIYQMIFVVFLMLMEVLK
ncbi:cation:proton antiporter [Tepiditoga spiralis]|uniref:Cation:proton antiporter n=1 Tax=Tepiditoga spiralis TaxID=2108365 RepID=A0A7G1G9A5_9BACT|nr:proton-conducting transporter membrane subunit [Tepiditoga spiralis]BBE32066.1 cation:proton antiporter [Tepiditoga spiralis]